MPYTDDAFLYRTVFFGENTKQARSPGTQYEGALSAICRGSGSGISDVRPVHSASRDGPPLILALRAGYLRHGSNMHMQVNKV